MEPKGQALSKDVHNDMKIRADMKEFSNIVSNDNKLKTLLITGSYPFV